MFGYSFGSEHLSKMASEILINGPINIFSLSYILFNEHPGTSETLDGDD
jgi:hypothetical protein